MLMAEVVALTVLMTVMLPSKSEEGFVLTL